jgi:hypothetical protein
MVVPGHAGVKVPDLLPKLHFSSVIFTPSDNMPFSLTGAMVGLPIELNSQ